MMLQKIGARAVILHSILKQKQRFSALEQFKSSKSRVLVATDVASRGLDLPHVAIVINHNVPGKFLLMYLFDKKFLKELPEIMFIESGERLGLVVKAYQSQWFHPTILSG